MLQLNVSKLSPKVFKPPISNSRNCHGAQTTTRKTADTYQRMGSTHFGNLTLGCSAPLVSQACLPSHQRFLTHPLVLLSQLTDLINVLDHISLWCLLLAIRRPMQLYANVRPVRSFPKTQSYLRNVAEGDIDWILVRKILKVNIVVKEGDLISTSHGSQQQRLPSLPESALNASCGLHLRLLKVDHGSFFQ